MSSQDIALIMGALVLLLIIRLPVAFALISAGILGAWVVGLPPIMAAQTAYGGLDSFLLIAIPLFILASALLTHGGVSKQLFDFASAWVAHLPGGLGVATVMTCAIFAAVSGSSVATAAAVGGVAYPELVSRGYEKRFAAGLIAAGGTLGILIPPSIPMIIYGAVTGVSVGQLFIAGIVPGLILVIVLIVYIITRSLIRGDARAERASWRERFEATRKAGLGLTLPPIVIGGIYGGIFTPSEAAAVAAVAALLISVYNDYNTVRRNIWSALLSTATTTSMICMLIVGAVLFGHAITVGQLPQKLSALVESYELSALSFVLSINLLFFAMGAFLEVIAIMLTTLPVIFPTLLSLQIDPVWFAVVMVVNMELALITPPVGMNLFIVQGATKLPLHHVARGVFPFVILIGCVLLAFVMFPGLTMIMR